MSNLNKATSQYVFILSAIIAIVALLLVEINVRHIDYKYTEGAEKPSINFNIFDSALFATDTYTQLFTQADSNLTSDANSSMYSKISTRFDKLISDSNLDEVVNTASLTKEVNSSDGNGSNKTVASVDNDKDKIEQLTRQLNALIERSSKQAIDKKKDIK